MNNEIPDNIKKILHKMAVIKYGPNIKPIVNENTEDGYYYDKIDDKEVYQFHFNLRPPHPPTTKSVMFEI